jgi:hypothetical protein
MIASPFRYLLALKAPIHDSLGQRPMTLSYIASER